MSRRTERIAAELLALQDADGKILPSNAVAWARSEPGSQLHAELEWDDAVAGERYRVQQVRQLIAIHIVEPEGYRQFVSLSIDREYGGGYRPMSEVSTRVDFRECLLSDAFNELERIQRKYHRLQELSEVWAATTRARTRRVSRKKAAA